MVHIGNEWDDLLSNQWETDYYKKLRAFLVKEYKTEKIHPDKYDIFNALKYTDYSDVKVVILGQDPYHGENQAHGLSFSVQKGIKIPPSLNNIYKEIENEYNITPASHGNLTHWAKQGVMLLNTVLTVREGKPNSHKNKGWEILTDYIITLLNNSDSHIVFLLWGNNARQKSKFITNKNHLVLETVHPSPLSAYNGFFGCNHFLMANEFLTKNGITPIDWSIPE